MNDAYQAHAGDSPLRLKFFVWRFVWPIVNLMLNQANGIHYNQIGNPDKMVIDIDGDSSFNHTLSDLKTIVEYNLPVKIINIFAKSKSL